MEQLNSIFYNIFQEWTEFLDRAFNIIIPHELESSSLESDSVIDKGNIHILCGKISVQVLIKDLTFKKIFNNTNHTIYFIVVDNVDQIGERVVLDIGCGPSISNIISASKFSQNIIMADFLDSNRKEVERFWKVGYNLV